MEINYWIVFFLVFVFVAYKLTKGSSEFSWRKLEDIGYFIIMYPSLAGLFSCIFIYAVSSTVVEIKPGEKHSENDFIFYYKDYSENVHIVVPFTNYLINESGKEIKIYKVGYGKYQSNKYEDIYYSIGEFKRIEEKPQDFFCDPPVVIKSKTSGAVRYVVDYK